MKNIDIEKFYTRISGHLALIAAYAENPLLPKIIRSCRLKPHSAFEENFEFSTKLNNHWVDEFGNSLYISPREMQLKLGDLANNPNSRNSTDLFYGSSLGATSRNSKFILAASGVDVISGKELFLISFYGVDEYIRTFIFTPPVWTRVSPLMMGAKTLEKFFSNLGTQLVVELNKKDLDFAIPFNIQKCIVTSWPSKHDIGFCFDKHINNKEQLVNG